MTDRTLPWPGQLERTVLDGPRRGATEATSRSPESRTASLSRALALPAHVGVLIGLSTGAYALSIAAVTGLQASSERVLLAERVPVAMAIDTLTGSHDRLDRELGLARIAYESAAAGYGAAGPGIEAIEAHLTSLTDAIAQIDVSTVALRRSALLAAASGRLSASVAGAAPRSVSGGAPGAVAPATAGLPTLVKSVAAPRPPTTNTTTAASGAP